MKSLLRIAALLVVGLASGPSLAGGSGGLSHNFCGSGPAAGLYAGAFAGYGFARTDLSVAGIPDLDDDDGAVTLGGFAGVNCQYGHTVLGLESDLAWSGAETSFSLAGQTVRSELDLIGSTRLRAGFMHDSMLFYATAGLAYASGDRSLSWPGIGFSQSDRDTDFGWVIGGGVELFRDAHWSLRAEVLHFDFSDTSIEYNADAATGCAFAPCRARLTYDDDITVARLGVAFKLGGEPVMHQPYK